MNPKMAKAKLIEAMTTERVCREALLAALGKRVVDTTPGYSGPNYPLVAALGFAGWRKTE